MAISNLTYKDYLWLTKEKDGVKGIRLSKDNLPSTLNPIASKTFEHVWSTSKPTAEAKTFTGSGTTGGSTSSLDYYIYFGSIKPIGASYMDSWHIKLRLITECETNTNYRSEHIFNLYGAGSTVSYAMFNNIYSGSYRNLYYVFLNRIKSTGFNNGFSHLFGIDFYSTNTQNINNSNYKRKFYIEILEQEGCEVSFFNDWISARNYTPATTSTNYYGYINTSNAVVGMGTEFNAVTNGLQETGDADNYFQIFSYFRPIAGGIGIQGVSLISQLEDGTWASFTTNNTQATDSTKTNSPNTTDFFLIGAPIWYYSNNTILAAGSIAAGDYVYSTTHAIDTRYISNYYSATKDNANSFAYNGSGYKQSNAYIKVDLFSGGRYKIRSLILNERDLRSSGEGYYIYIGRTYSNSAYQINLEAQNPIFYWNGSHFIEYSNYNYVTKRNQLENNIDLNTITTTGFYRLNNTHANSPNAPFGQMLVCQAYGDTIAQIVFRYNEPKMFLRTGNVVNNSAGSWTEWKTVSTDDHTHDDRYYTETEIDTKISGTSGTIPKFTAANTIGNSAITQSAQNDITIAGKLVVQSNGSTSNNSYNEGIRILPASNAWSNIFFSNNQTTSNQHANGWLLGKRGSNGTTSGLVGDFTIECNGSSGAGLTLSSDVKNKPRWNNNELAYYSDIPTYWANVQLSKTSNSDTTPTFASVDIKSKCTISYSATADALEFIFK